MQKATDYDLAQVLTALDDLRYSGGFEEMAAAVKVLIDLVPKVLSRLDDAEDFGLEVDEKYVIAAAKAKFLAEYPYGQSAAKKFWDEHQQALLYETPATDPYALSTRFLEAETMLLGALGELSSSRLRPWPITCATIRPPKATPR